jgi:dipeptidyl aminopeptidase/acylaminoacyl peptidase
MPTIPTSMTRLAILFVVLPGLSGCGVGTPDKAAITGPDGKRLALNDARRGFESQILADQEPGDPAPMPPPGVFERIQYRSPAGSLVAYITPDPGDGQKHPAIVWITGGDCNSIGEVWEPADRDNDQSAAAYREAGLVMMFPSLRGGNGQPGHREGFLGEIDDVIAAAKVLAKRPYVDPDRIYLGGHSTGGTLAMLVAESTDRFRAVFAFGPVNRVSRYGGNFVYHASGGDPKEELLRSPENWLDSVKSPLFVIEGSDGNSVALRSMRSQNSNRQIQFIEVEGQDHFGILAPANAAIAAKIVADTGPTCGISLQPSELAGP